MPATNWPDPRFTGVPPLGEARALADQARQDLGVRSARVDVRSCCSLAGVDLVDASLGDAGREALLIPRSRGFRIVINSDFIATTGQQALGRQRRRFRVAHELGHTFFYSLGTGRPRRRFPSGGLEEERFCDEFARSLLAPSPEGEVCADEVLALQARYDVSLEVAARTAAASRHAPRVGLWWWVAPAPGRRAALLEQWVSDSRLSTDLAIKPYRTDPMVLCDGFPAPDTKLNAKATGAILSHRRQVLAVVADT